MGPIDFVKKSYREPEDIGFDIEWIEIVIKGNPQQEEEEYAEAMGMYKSLGQLFKSEMPKDENFSKPFKTTRLTDDQLNKAYKAGYGAAKNETIAQRLLDLGILTYIEKIDDRIEKDHAES